MQSAGNKTEKSWVLGASYQNEKYNTNNEFKNHAEAFFRFTYRKDFPSLYPYPISSDSGWGCMLRAAQMMMGYGFRRHYLGIDWRLPKNKESLRNSLDYCDILQWFVDYPGYPHIYSIHHMVQCGMKYDKLPGEWFGPSTAALVLRDLARLHRVKYHGPLEVMVTQGDTIYVTEAERICCDTSLSCNASIALLAASTTHNKSVGAVSTSVIADGSGATIGEQSLHAAVAVADVQPAGAAFPPTIATPKPTSTSAAARQQPRVAASHDPFFDPLLHQPPSAVAPWAHALMVILPLRLGISSVNQEYIEEIKEVLRNKRCIGIIGGRPNHAIYFVGYNSDDELLGLDPHTTYTTPDITVTTATAITNTNNNTSSSGSTATSNIFPNAEYLSQIHVPDLVRMPFGQLDPSLGVGFYFQDRADFQQFCDETRVATAAKLAAGKSPLYAVQHSPPSFMLDSSSSDDDDDDDDDDEVEETEDEEDNEDMHVDDACGSSAQQTGGGQSKSNKSTKSSSCGGGKRRGGRSRRKPSSRSAAAAYDFDSVTGGEQGVDVEEEYVFL